MNAKTSLLIMMLTMNIGCQRMATSGGAVESLQSASCASAKSVDASRLTIVGTDDAAPGDALNYRLSDDVGCGSAAPTVSWKMVSATAAGAGGVFSAKISRAGSYVVSAEVQAKDASTPVVISKQTTVGAVLALTGPQVGMTFVENTYSLAVPADVTITDAVWSFGDGTAAVHSTSSVTHAFTDAGTFNLTVRVTSGGGQIQTLAQSVQIIPVREGYECMNQLALSGGTSVGVGVPVNLTLFVPTCLTSKVSHLGWSFGDGTPDAAAQSVQHTFQAVGTYPVSVRVYQGTDPAAFATLNTTVTVAALDPAPPIDEPDQNQCATLGQTRVISGEIYTEDAACGVNGHRTNSYRDQITEACQKPTDLRRWIETGRTKSLVNEGACQGQACAVPTGSVSAVDLLTSGLSLIKGQYYLLDGASRTFFTSANPAGSCAEVSSVRSCANGSRSVGPPPRSIWSRVTRGARALVPSGTVLAGQW